MTEPELAKSWHIVCHSLRDMALLVREFTPDWDFPGMNYFSNFSCIGFDGQVVEDLPSMRAARVRSLVATYVFSGCSTRGWRELWSGLFREMKNKSRGPTFGDFVTISTEVSMQDITVARLQSTREHTPLFPPLLNVMYCVRVSLWTVKIFLAQH